MKKYVDGLVSVVMPTYKRSDKLTRAIESALNQTYNNIELLLVNDNEPEDIYTYELKKQVERYTNDKRFHLVMQERHINGAVARNVGIKQARGQYVAFLDDDDWWETKKIEQQIEILNQLDNSWGGVSCKFTLYDENGRIVGKTSKYRDGYIYKDILYLISDVATGTLLLRHELLDTTRYFDENLLRHQDLQLLVEFTSKYKLKEVDKYLHCADVSDTQNRPDPQKLVRYKRAFFKSVRPIMNTLTEKERRCVYAMHKYEIGYVYIKSGDVRNGIRYFASVFGNFKVLTLAARKTANKVVQVLKR